MLTNTRGALRVSFLSLRCLSSQAAPHVVPDLPPYLVQENKPSMHTALHVSKFYTVPPGDYNKLLLHKGLHKSYQQLIHLLGECCLMIRQPGLEVKQYLEKADYDMPPNKYLLYGKYGAGKTSVLAYLLHYCYSQKWLIFNIPEVFSWINEKPDMTPNQIKKDLWDTPKESAQFLQNFLNTNKLLLKELDLKVTETIEWSQREKTEKDTSLEDLINFGITRTIYSSECVRVLLREIVHHSASGRFKTLIAADGINYLYDETEDEKFDKLVPVASLTFMDAFLEFLRNQKLKNGAFIFTTNNFHFRREKWKNTHWPLALLTQQGFDDIEPFVPVLVDKMTDLEFNNWMDYYVDKRWIQHPAARLAEGRDELKFLCGMLPGDLQRLVSSL